jgi:hypothetical protein
LEATEERWVRRKRSEIYLPMRSFFTPSKHALPFQAVCDGLQAGASLARQPAAPLFVEPTVARNRLERAATQASADRSDRLSLLPLPAAAAAARAAPVIWLLPAQCRAASSRASTLFPLYMATVFIILLLTGANPLCTCNGILAARMASTCRTDISCHCSNRIASSRRPAKIDQGHVTG